MKNKIHINKTFFQWGLFYVFISTIVFLGFWICMKQYTNEIEQEKEASNTIMLEMLRLEMDQTIQNLNVLSSSLILDSAVSELRYISSYNSVGKYRIYEIVKTLNNYSLIRSNQDSIVLYFPHLDLMMSQSYYNMSEDFYQIQLNSFGFSYEEWYSIISEAYTDTQIFSLTNYRKNNSDYCVLVRTINNLPSKSCPVNVIMILDINEILPYSKLLYEQRETILIVDEKCNSVITESELSEEMLQAVLQEISQSSVGHSTIDINGRRSVVSFIQSEKGRFKYIVINPETVWVQRLKDLQNVVILFILCYLIISGSCLYFSVIRFSRPVKKIMEMLGGDNKTHNKLIVSDYDYITGRIEAYLDENNKIHTVIQNQRNAIRHELLHRLIMTSKQSELPEEHLLTQYGIRLTSERFLIISYQVQVEEEMSADDMQIVLFVLGNITKEVLVERKFPVYSLTEGNLQTYIICSPVAMESPREIILTCIDKIRSFIAEHYQFDFRIAVSNEHVGRTEINEAYSEAQKVFRYQRNHVSYEVIAYRDIKVLGVERLLKIPVEAENQLFSSIMEGDTEHACCIVHWLIEQNFKNCMTLEAMQFLVGNITSIIVQAANKYIKDDQQVMSAVSFIEIKVYETSESLYEALSAIIKKICSEVTKAREQIHQDKLGEMIEFIKKYVENNYSDCTMGVSTIAERFDLKQTYLSKVFKDHEGDNLSAFINLVRLKYAKERILRGEKLESVSQSCGFGSQRTFLRLFKQYIGVTPTKYKGMEEEREFVQEN